MMEKVLVFRVADNEHTELIRRELKNGRLRQGWGGTHSEITADNEISWVEEKLIHTEDTEENRRYYRKRYRILKRMLEICPGDIIIIPKTPASWQFTLCTAAGKYKFENISGYDVNDFQHMIPVENVKVFSYHSSETSQIIHAKLRAYQSPVNFVWSESITAAAKTLMTQEENTEDLTTARMVMEIKDGIYRESALNRFRQLGSKQTENIIRLVFEKMGFECKRNNSFDRKGGDADLIFTNNSLSVLMEAGLNGAEVAGQIYVQVKNKDGKDLWDMEGINQLCIRTNGDPTATKVLISTADDFTPECKKQANEKNILLINGRGFLDLVFRYLD